MPGCLRRRESADYPGGIRELSQRLPHAPASSAVVRICEEQNALGGSLRFPRLQACPRSRYQHCARFAHPPGDFSSRAMRRRKRTTASASGLESCDARATAGVPQSAWLPPRVAPNSRSARRPWHRRSRSSELRPPLHATDQRSDAPSSPELLLLFRGAYQAGSGLGNLEVVYNCILRNRKFLMTWRGRLLPHRPR